jgi:HEAT repeat protein
LLENAGNRLVDSDSKTRTRPSFDVFVFFRFEMGKMSRISSLDSGCDIDASGATLHWLTGVSPSESVAYLLSLVSRDAARSLSSAAIAAISFHAEGAADQALEKLVAAGQPASTREQAAFWIASERGPHGLDVIRKLAREDGDEKFRRYLAFCFSIVPDDSAVQDLIRMAHDDAASGVRSQALFWMAQKAGARVTGEITAAIQNDPDTEVKRQAVFALAQMPHGEGTSKLIEVARTNRNPAVRKQAVFWLGQSSDPQALKFIEDVLTR